MTTGAARTVLVVEDEQENRDVLCDIVEEVIGATALPATSAAQGLEFAVERQPTLILMDLMMPDMDGYEAIRRLKQQAATRRIPIIAVSALSGRDDREQALAAGCVDYISKPFDLDQLADIVTRHLSQAESGPTAGDAGAPRAPA